MSDLVLRSVLAVLALTATACGVSASGPGDESRAELPAGMPGLSGRVVDEADLLSADAEASLTNKSAALEGRRTDQFVVVTLPSLHGRTIEDMGLRLGRGWGVGQKDKDNGVLLIVAPTERRVRIEVGSGLERAIADQEAARIIDERILPLFRSGAMEKGILAGADAIIAELDRSPPVQVKR